MLQRFVPPPVHSAVQPTKDPGRVVARKVPKTVSPHLVRILTVCEAMGALSVFYLVDWYYNRRPMPSWVLTLAGGTLIAIIASQSLCLPYPACETSLRFSDPGPEPCPLAENLW